MTEPCDLLALAGDRHDLPPPDVDGELLLTVEDEDEPEWFSELASPAEMDREGGDV